MKYVVLVIRSLSLQHLYKIKKCSLLIVRFSLYDNNIFAVRVIFIFLGTMVMYGSSDTQIRPFDSSLQVLDAMCPASQT